MGYTFTNTEKTKKKGSEYETFAALYMLGLYPQKEKKEQTAQAILDARFQFPEASLADLYNPLTMPPALRKAHESNDKAVEKAYGFAKDMTESEIVAELFKMYEKLTAGK